MTLIAKVALDIPFTDPFDYLIPENLFSALKPGNLVLVPFGWRYLTGIVVEIKEDSVFARLEGREQDFICERLKGLGYLTIHTRQLDMIMSDKASAQSYWAKIRKDLNTVVRSK